MLVVEDEFIVRYGLADELRETGFRVVEADSADEAWKYLSAGGRADLIFSDVQMPGAMSGIDLARRVHERFPGIPLILTSGNVNPQAMGSSVPFVPKPYLIGNVVVLITQTLKKQR